MAYAIEFGDGPFEAVVTLSGRTTFAEIGENDARLFADPRFQTGMNLLYDLSRLEPTGQGSGEDVRAMAHRDSRPETFQRPGAIAIVAPNDAVYGVARMWLVLIDEKVAARTTVVRTHAEAYDWLAAAGR